MVNQLVGALSINTMIVEQTINLEINLMTFQ